jgi:hypothetical protein
MKKLLRANGAALSDSRSPNGSARSHRWIVLIVLALAVATTSGSVQAISALPTANAVTATASSGSTMTLTRPATVAAGDVLIASVEAAVSANVQIAAPSGWVLIRRDSNAPGYAALTQALYYKVAGTSEPSTYAWSLSLPAPVTGAVLDLAGVDTSSPVDAHGGAFNPSTRSVQAPSITTTVPGDVVVGFFGVSAKKSLQSPSGMTQEFMIRSTDSAEGAAYVQGNAGATGTKKASASAPTSASAPASAPASTDAASEQLHEDARGRRKSLELRQLAKAGRCRLPTWRHLHGGHDRHLDGERNPDGTRHRHRVSG